jgi:hypothetical protein
VACFKMLSSVSLQGLRKPQKLTLMYLRAMEPSAHQAGACATHLEHSAKKVPSFNEKLVPGRSSPRRRDFP